MYKAIYGEDREWAPGRIGGGRGRGGHGIRERNERVMRVLKEWEFFPMLPYARFFSSTFLMHESLFSLIEPFATNNSAFHFFQISVLRPDHFPLTDLQSRSPHQTKTPQQSTRSAPDQTTKSEYHTRPSSDPTTIKPSDQTVTTIPDHQIRSSQQTTILDYSVSDQHSTTILLEWYRLGAFLMGWVKGGYIELWMNLAKHTFHTRSA